MFFEMVKTFNYALLASLIFVFVREVLPYVNSHKAAGIGVLRAEGYSPMLVGFFVFALGVLLSRFNMVYDGGRLHIILMR